MNLPTRKEMNAVGLTQIEVAKLLGVTPETVRNAMKRETKTTGKIRILLAKKRKEAGLK